MKGIKMYDTDERENENKGERAAAHAKKKATREG